MPNTWRSCKRTLVSFRSDDKFSSVINRDAIREVGGISAIVKLVTKYGESLELDSLPLYFQICRVLGNLCFEHAVNAKIICEHDKVLQVVISFVDFCIKANDMNLAKSTCACLANFSHADGM